jgi:hypothetical protein
MKIILPVRSILKPSSLSMVAVSLSLAAWLFPTFGVLKKGFENPSRLDTATVVILACWYLLIFTSFFLGQKIAGLWSLSHGYKPTSRLLDLESNVIYLGFTLIGALGLGAMVATIVRSMSLSQMILFISLGQSNALKNTVYEEYHVGIVSLRYVVLYPASVALYRMIRFRKYSLLNLFNVLMLAVCTFLSFRLILIAALVTTSLLVTFDRESVKLSVTKLVLVAGSLFLILSVLNLSRNAAYYERNNLSFGLAGLNEIIAYLGTPFQVAIGSANVTDQLVAKGPSNYGLGTEAYRYFVDIMINYNTNSAFVALHQQMGYWCWPYIALLCGFMGAVFRFLISLGKTYFLLPCGGILYASSELWRLDLFQQGAFIVWFVIGIGFPASVLFAEHLWSGGGTRTPDPLLPKPKQGFSALSPDDS